VLKEAELNCQNRNFYATTFLCKESAENILRALHARQLQREIPMDILVALPRLAMPEEIRQKFETITRVYNPLYTKTSKFANDFISATKELMQFYEKTGFAESASAQPGKKTGGS